MPYIMAQSTQTKKKSSTASNTNTKTKSKTAAKGTQPVKKQEEPPKKSIKREIAAVIFAFLGFLTIIGIFSSDGFVVGGLCTLLKGLTGWGFWLWAPAFLTAAVILFFHRGRPVVWRTIAAICSPILFGAIADLLFAKTLASADGIGAMVSSLYKSGSALASGGVLGGLISYGGEQAFSVWGAGIILLLLFIFFVLSALNVTAKSMINRFAGYDSAESDADAAPRPKRVQKQPEEAPPVSETDERLAQGIKAEKRRRAIDIPLDEPEKDESAGLFAKKSKKTATARKVQPEKKQTAAANTENVAPVSIEEAASIAGVSAAMPTEPAEAPKKKMSAAEVAAETAAVASQIESTENDDGEYERPPIYLLKKGHANTANVDEELRLNRDRLESTIKSFGVNARIVGTTHGPTVTRYDLELEQGVKLSRLTNLAGDIALALGVVSVRIAPIPDKISTVGIEVPNKLVSTVYLRDIIDSPKFASSKSKLSFAIGKDIGGDPIVGNISKLPHLLIAGTTGSGKSVCMNSLIISLLYKADPDEVKLIMIDPKMVELGVYNGIPHLYIPVVTDPKKAAGALQWAVTEMLKRYRLFSELGVRSLQSYNEHLAANGQPKMPSVVIVIDELADLMLVASKEVEESICRVAQMGRAAGMHLVIATQRPSADVITGLMKANIPSRIAFAVSSALESRIILDNQGAEKLIGMGDMLYAPIGCGKPLRVQGAFVSDEERDGIVSFIKEQASAEYSEDIMAQIEKAAEDKGSNGKAAEHDDAAPASSYDELLPQAVDVIFESKQASVSMLQRRLKLGYSRAARIIDQMEEIGVVGPFEGSKPRQILISRDQWLEMQTINGTAPTEVLQTQLEFADEISSDISEE